MRSVPHSKNPPRSTSYGLKSLVKARRSVLAAQTRDHGSTASYLRAHQIRSNPVGLGDVFKVAVPVSLSTYGTRYVINRWGGAIPFVSKLGTWAKPAVNAGALALTYAASKWASGKWNAVGDWAPFVLVGQAISTIDATIAAIAPADLKADFGLAGTSSLGRYVPRRKPVGRYASNTGRPQRSATGAYAGSLATPSAASSSSQARARGGGVFARAPRWSMAPGR